MSAQYQGANRLPSIDELRAQMPEASDEFLHDMLMDLIQADDCRRAYDDAIRDLKLSNK